MSKRFRKGQYVYDTWWPYREGRVQRVGKTRVRVRWEDGKQETYDRAHMKFLKLCCT